MRYASLMLLGVMCLWGCEGAITPMRTTGPDAPTPDASPGADISAPDMSPGTPDMLRADMGDMMEPSDMGPPPVVDPHPNTLVQERLFMCNGEPGSSPARIRRMEAYEWANSISSAEGNRVPLLSGASHAYSTYSLDETIDAPTLQEYLRQNHLPAGSWSRFGGNGHPRLINLRGGGSLEGAVRCFQWSWNDRPVQENPDDACITQFVTHVLEHGVYFRTPTPEEVTRLVTFAQQQLVKEKADPEIDRRDTIRVVIRAAWMTHGAIFRREFGVPGPDGRRKLTDEELSLALSLALTDHAAGLSKPGYGNDSYEIKVRLPDVQAAAQDGTLSDPEVLATLTRRYLAGLDPAAVNPMEHPSDHPPGSTSYTDQYWMSAKLQRFFREWLGYADAASIFKDTPAATSRFGPIRSGVPSFRHGRYVDNTYKSAQLATRLDDTIARIVAEDQDVLETLLTTSRFLLPHVEVASGDSSKPYPGFPYDLDTTEVGEIGPGLAERWVEVPGRAGVLTHPAWLAAHGGNFENDPSAIERGKWVYEELLCGLVPPIPVTVDAQLSPETKGDSARARLSSQLDAKPECAGCHRFMNPFGYAFEIYNHAGFVRAEDHGAPPSGAAVLTDLPPGPDAVLTPGMQVTGAPDMMQKFAAAPRVKRCFVRQTFRYFMGRDETYADACSLQRMERAYDDSGGSLVEMLVALFQSDAFLYRHIEEMP